MQYLCKKCGATREMYLENSETGELEPLGICKNCMFYGAPKAMEENLLKDRNGNENPR